MYVLSENEEALSKYSTTLLFQTQMVDLHPFTPALRLRFLGSGQVDEVGPFHIHIVGKPDSWHLSRAYWSRSESRPYNNTSVGFLSRAYFLRTQYLSDSGTRPFLMREKGYARG